MADVIRTIGTGGDYSTPALWEADLGTLATYPVPSTAIGEMFNQEHGGGGTLTINGAYSTIPQLRPYAGAGHDGTAGSGARYRGLLNCDQLTVTLEHIEVFLSTVASSSGWLMSHSKNLNMRRLLLHARVGNTNSNMGCVLINSTVTAYEFHNCIIYHIRSSASSQAVQGFYDQNTNAGTKRLYNNTINNIRNTGSGSGPARAYQLGGSSARTARNNVAGNVTSNFGVALDFNAIAGTYSNNASEDGTALGSSSITGISPASQYISVVEGSEDYHLVSGSGLRGLGFDVGTTPTEVNQDIDEYDRDATGVVWDIGADQYVSEYLIRQSLHFIEEGQYLHAIKQGI